MDLSLFKVLSLSPFDRCRVVAGASGLSKTITSINVVDCPDPGPWVSKGQLVFTTGYVFKDDPSEQVRLIRRLTEQGCCGMAIKFSRFLPDPPKEMLREADLLEFPLIDIPCDLSLSELMASLMGGILEYRHYQNRQEEIVGFISALLSGELCERDRILAEGRFIGLQPNCCYVGL